MDGRKKKKLGKSRIQKTIIFTVIAAVLVISATSTYALASSNKIKDWEDKIYPNVKVQGVDLSGKTKNEAVETLKSDFIEKVSNKKIEVKVDDKVFNLNYSDINPQFNIEEMVDKAISLGKDSNFFSKKSWINGKHNENLYLDFNYDENKVEEFKNSIKDGVKKSSKNASISVNNGQITITPEVNGLSVNEEELNNKLKEAIDGSIDEDSEITMSAEVDKPAITQDELSKINYKISTAQTNYASSGAGRAANVELATKFCNGKLLMPGEEFSYNEVVGERSAARGFKDAAVFVGDRVEQGIGGGICQVSTTLYRAAMEANLKSTERYNHSMLPGYSLPGLDATVVWGVLDYKFKNNYNFPVYVEGYTSNRNIVFNIYGNKEGMEDKTYKLVAETTGTLQPAITTKEDSNLDEGKTQWEKNPVIGYKAKSYLVTYQNGKEISREAVSSDTYTKVDGVVKKGTKKAAPVETKQEEKNQTEQKQEEQKPAETTNSSEATQSEQ